MDERDHFSNQCVQSIKLALKNLTDDQYTLACKSDEVRNITDEFVSKESWAKREVSFYMDEINHTALCDDTERVEPPCSSNDYQDELVKMDAVCGDILDSMDAIYNCLTARTAHEQRVGPILKRVVSDESKKILSCNKRNNMIFSRCNEKRYIEDPSSRITNNQVMDIIEHVIAFGSSFLPGAPMTYAEFIAFLNVTNRIFIKNVSPASFSSVRTFMNEKIIWHTKFDPLTRNPYFRTNHLTFTVLELEYIVSILDKDRAKSMTHHVQLPLPAVLNTDCSVDELEETISDSEDYEVDVVS